MSEAKGTFEDFLEALLTFESGLDPSHLADYKDSNQKRTYSAVDGGPAKPIPGSPHRDVKTGKVLEISYTNEQWFRALGLDHSSATHDEASLRSARYASTNYLGFIGYQLGESSLIDTGYWVPPHDAAGYDKYYVWVDDAIWANGVTEHRYEIPHADGSAPTVVIATDRNRWDTTGGGHFTGKNGLKSLADLKKPDFQNLVIRDLVQHNYEVLLSLVGSSGLKLGSSASAGGKTATITLSGLLAASHLSGPWGVAAALQDKTAWPHDEKGTNSVEYLEKFGGYNTLLDTPGNDEIVTSSHLPETVIVGLGRDHVIIPDNALPSAAKTIIINPSSGGHTTVGGFRFGIDRIDLRKFANVSVNLPHLPNGVEAIPEIGSVGAIRLNHNQVIEFSNHSVDDVKNGATSIRAFRLHEFKWSVGTSPTVINDFDPAVDRFKGVSSMDSVTWKSVSIRTSRLRLVSGSRV